MEEFVLAVVIILVVGIVGHIDMNTTGWIVFGLFVFGVSTSIVSVRKKYRKHKSTLTEKRQETHQ